MMHVSTRINLTSCLSVAVDISLLGVVTKASSQPDGSETLAWLKSKSEDSTGNGKGIRNAKVRQQKMNVALHCVV